MHSMRVLIRARHSARKSQFFRHLRLRAMETLAIFQQEYNRSLTAAHRYEELRIGRGTDLPLGGRGSKARQVFDEIYSGSGAYLRILK